MRIPDTFFKGIQSALDTTSAIALRLHDQEVQTEFDTARNSLTREYNNFIGSLKADADYNNYTTRFEEINKKIFDDINKNIRHTKAKNQFQRFYNEATEGVSAQIQLLSNEKKFNWNTQQFNENIKQAIQNSDRVEVTRLVSGAKVDKLLSNQQAEAMLKDSMYQIRTNTLVSKALQAGGRDQGRAFIIKEFDRKDSKGNRLYNKSDLGLLLGQLDSALLESRKVDEEFRKNAEQEELLIGLNKIYSNGYTSPQGILSDVDLSNVDEAGKSKLINKWEQYKNVVLSEIDKTDPYTSWSITKAFSDKKPFTDIQIMIKNALDEKKLSEDDWKKFTTMNESNLFKDPKLKRLLDPLNQALSNIEKKYEYDFDKIRNDEFYNITFNTINALFNTVTRDYLDGKRDWTIEDIAQMRDNLMGDWDIEVKRNVQSELVLQNKLKIEQDSAEALRTAGMSAASVYGASAIEGTIVRDNIDEIRRQINNELKTFDSFEQYLDNAKNGKFKGLLEGETRDPRAVSALETYKLLGQEQIEQLIDTDKYIINAGNNKRTGELYYYLLNPKTKKTEAVINIDVERGKTKGILGLFKSDTAKKIYRKRKVDVYGNVGWKITDMSEFR